MHQEHQKYRLRKNAESRQARYRAGGDDEETPDVFAAGGQEPNSLKGEAKSKPATVKRDFFGRIIKEAAPSSDETHSKVGDKRPASKGSGADDRKVWVSFHEGFSNAVRKPITLEELMAGFQ